MWRRSFVEVFGDWKALQRHANCKEICRWLRHVGANSRKEKFCEKSLSFIFYRPSNAELNLSLSSPFYPKLEDYLNSLRPSSNGFIVVWRQVWWGNKVSIRIRCASSSVSMSRVALSYSDNSYWAVCALVVEELKISPERCLHRLSTLLLCASMTQNEIYWYEIYVCILFWRKNW